MTKPLSVLLVEDTEDDALLLERVLKQGGYLPTMHRVDCREALQFALQKNKWDIIITDYNLPGFNFESALRLIHENEIDTPIIIVSGSIGEEAAVKAMKAGANDYVMKDNLTRLSPAIERELREAEIRRQRREAENTIRHLAFYDPLTLLPNRRLLMDRLEHALQTSTRGKNHGALLYIDLDNFKHLNDTKGHQHGDLLLKEIALRLKNCVREEDTVARLGGDEFVVMLENLDTQADHALIHAKTIADKIITTISQPWHIDNFEYYPSGSIGVILFQGETGQQNKLLSQADTAMYEAKKAGRNRLKFFDPIMQHALEKRLALEHTLRQAIAKNQFQLYYQLQVNNHNQPLGVEALIRWIHPDKGIVSPNEFIPLAEENRLIDDIGQWVLETACNKIKSWQQCPFRKNLTVSVNVSPTQFTQQNFVKTVHNTAEKLGVDATKLKLELTESTVLIDVEDTIVKMQQLRARGFSLSLDDFGTGYSSLSYLNRLPFNQIKIDQSFILRAVSNANDAYLAQVVINIGQKFGMEVVAEGIETQDQLELIKKLGCNIFQGYFFGKPLSSVELESRLNKFA